MSNPGFESIAAHQKWQWPCRAILCDDSDLIIHEKGVQISTLRQRGAKPQKETGAKGRYHTVCKFKGIDSAIQCRDHRKIDTQKNPMSSTVFNHREKRVQEGLRGSSQNREVKANNGIKSYRELTSGEQIVGCRTKREHCIHTAHCYRKRPREAKCKALPVSGWEAWRRMLGFACMPKPSFLECGENVAAGGKKATKAIYTKH